MKSSSLLDVLAVDLGAESGRVVAARFDGSRLTWHEVHRFTTPATAGGRWDAQALVREVRDGLVRAQARGIAAQAVAVDAWGADYGVLEADGSLVGSPRQYRSFSPTAAADVLARVERDELYDRTGIQHLPFNTIFQLAAHRDELAAGTVLFIPDLVAHQLCGVTQTELTIASTSQLLSIRGGEWDIPLLERVGLPVDAMPEIGAPGTAIGRLHSGLLSGRAPKVVSVASHDTAAAVVAIPHLRDDAAYISSGTWSLVGFESLHPVVDRSANISNERGFGGTYRVLKNVSGLWLLQACRRAWGGDVTYDRLVAEAENAPPGGPLVDPDAPELAGADSVPEALDRLCRRSGWNPPRSRGEVVRCLLESLACKYRVVLDEIGDSAGREFVHLCIVGGGAQNRFLNQLTADATGLPVHAGPFEAASVGNALMQLHALGAVDGLEQMRAVAARSTYVRTFVPDPGRGDELYERFQTRRVPAAAGAV